jgi:hypothetical protein
VEDSGTIVKMIAYGEPKLAVGPAVAYSNGGEFFTRGASSCVPCGKSKSMIPKRGNRFSVKVMLETN